MFFGCSAHARGDSDADQVPRWPGLLAAPPSVCVLPSGEILVGQAANRQHAKDPSRYRREFKRGLGTWEPFVLGDRMLCSEELVKSRQQFLDLRVQYLL